MRDMQRSQAQDLRSDPTRKKLNRNYKHMLEIQEILTQKSIHDEQIEIRQQYCSTDEFEQLREMEISHGVKSRQN